MSKLEKGQNINNSAEETAVELDGKIDGRRVNFQSSSHNKSQPLWMRKTNSMKRKLKLEKCRKDGLSGKREKNGTRGGGRASKKKK